MAEAAAEKDAAARNKKGAESARAVAAQNGSVPTPEGGE